MQRPNSGDEPIRSDFAEDPDMLELVEEFVCGLPERVETLRNSFETGDTELLERMAHQLSGACAGYGFAPIGDAARDLEARLKQLNAGGELLTLRAQVDELVDLCRRVVV